MALELPALSVVTGLITEVLPCSSLFAIAALKCFDLLEIMRSLRDLLAGS